MVSIVIAIDLSSILLLQGILFFCTGYKGAFGQKFIQCMKKINYFQKGNPSSLKFKDGGLRLQRCITALYKYSSFGCRELRHMIFLMLRKKELLVKMSKFTITGDSCLMRISLLQISLLQFFKILHKYLAYAFFDFITGIFML